MDKGYLIFIYYFAFVKVNSDFSSFFRVFYSDEMLNKLLQGIKDREVDVIDRFQIADDLFNVKIIFI